MKICIVVSNFYPKISNMLIAGAISVLRKKRNYSYQIIGRNVRIFPRPSVEQLGQKLWFSVGLAMDPHNPSYQDDSIQGVNSPSNIPFGNLTYSKINSMGRQWIRQYTLANCKELLGQIRSKFGSVPIAGGDLTLNGSDLLSAGKEEKEKLTTEFREMLDSLTYDKLLESQAAEVDNMRTILNAVPIPLGKAITMG